MASAQSSEHITELQYDASGRVISVETAVEQAPPSVTGIEPAVLRHGPPVTVTVSGSGLRGVAVTGSHPGLWLSAISSSESRVRLQVQVDESVPLGEQRLRLSTALGDAEVAFTVRPRLPVLSALPNPLALAPGQSAQVTLSLDREDVIAHALSVGAQPSSRLSVSPNGLSVPAGGRAPGTVTVQASELGNGRLQIDGGELGELLVPVFVTPPFQPPAGRVGFYATPLGVHLDPGPGEPRLVSRGPFLARLGVVMPGLGASGPARISPLSAAVLGVSVGPVARGLEPSVLVRGEAERLIEVVGSGLQEVSEATVHPAADLSLSIEHVDVEGGRVLLRAGAQASAALGPRALQLRTAEGALIPLAASMPALRVAESPPELHWISPQLVLRGSPSASLLLRGERLASAKAVRVHPADGIVVEATPQPAGDGSTLQVRLAIAADAALGPRSLSVVAEGGESSAVPEAANTFHVVEALGPRVSPVLSAQLGVSLGDAVAGTRSQSLYTPALGLVVGAHVTGLEPAVGQVGSTVTLSLQGSGLDTVDSVRFEPAEGVWTQAPDASPDGRTLNVEVDIDPAAARGLRRVVVEAGGNALPSTRPAAMQLRVVEAQPEIDTVAPLLLVAGGGEVSLVVSGRRFNDATGVRLVPEDGIRIHGFTVSEGGQRMTVRVEALAGAPLGPRTLVVDTPTGSSDTGPTPRNTVQVAQALGARFSPLLSMQLGVQVGEVSVGSRRIDLPSAVLGVMLGEPPDAAPRSVALNAAVLGVSLGPVARSAAPHYLPAGFPARLRVEGVGLDAVTQLLIQPADGILIDGEPEPAADGSAVEWPLLVDAGAAHTVRSLILQIADGSVLPFTTPDAGSIRIVGSEPRIDSISPINVLPGQTFNLLIRGGGFFGVEAVTATPPTGLSISINPSVNAEGDQILVPITVAADAPGGPRVIRVVAAGGTTTGDAVPANTLTVVTGE